MTKNQITLAFMGWVPMRGTLHHALYHPESRNIVRPIGQDKALGGGYIWSQPNKPSEHEIEWDQWPDFYEAMEEEVLRDGANSMTSSAPLRLVIGVWP
jgi:hypothetical protein